MLKILFLGGLLFLNTNVWADECIVNGVEVLNDPTVFIPAIEKSETCYEATQLAEACAWGSSLDVQTAYAAYSVCDAELATYKPSLKALKFLDQMKDQCNEKYMNEEGTMYRSMMSFCHLTAISWAINMAAPN